MPLNIPARHNDKLAALVAAINADLELAQWWKCANVNAVDRQGMTDHGEVHIRITANAALKLLRRGKHLWRPDRGRFRGDALTSGLRAAGPGWPTSSPSAFRVPRPRRFLRRRRSGGFRPG